MPSLTLLDIAEQVFVYVSLFLFSGAFIAPFFAPLQQTTDDLVWLRYLWLPVYAGSVFFILRSLPRMLMAALPCILFFVLVFWIYLSVLWTIGPEITSRRAFAFAATTVFGLYFGARFSRGEGVAMLARVMTVLAAGSLIAVFAYPKMGVQHDINAGLWRGLWYEKNTLGAMMATGVIACVSAGIVTGKARPVGGGSGPLPVPGLDVQVQDGAPVRHAAGCDLQPDMADAAGTGGGCGGGVQHRHPGRGRHQPVPDGAGGGVQGPRQGPDPDRPHPDLGRPVPPHP